MSPRALPLRRAPRWLLCVVLLLHAGLAALLLHGAPARSVGAKPAPVFVYVVPSAPAKPAAAVMPPARAVARRGVPPAVSAPVAPLPAAIAPDAAAEAQPESISTTAEAAPAPSVASNAAQSTASAPPLPLIHEVAYLRAPAPRYPAASRRLGETGTALVRVLIDRDGRPARVELLQSSGVERLDQAALEAVRAALFQPYRENGVAAPAVALVPIRFELS
jgi:protein TonB